MKTHEDLLASHGYTGNQLFAAFKLLPAEKQQKVWKKFESSRKKSGNDESYQGNTKGHGGQSKKKGMLRGWLADGAKRSKHYRGAMATVSHAQTREVQIAWLTWAQAVTKYGKKEGLARLKRGSHKFRTSPTDSKFMEFSDLTETNKHAL